MIRPASRRGYCDSCHAYLPLTEGFPDRDGRTLWFCHTCTATPTPAEIDAARDRIKFAWSERVELTRRFDLPTALAQERLAVFLDSVYTVNVHDGVKDD